MGQLFTVLTPRWSSPPWQGFSTGLPERLQLALLHSLPGLERCAMLRPAYAVEYDYLPAHQCHASLETKKVRGLFFSGQLNGTTGVAATVFGHMPACPLLLFFFLLSFNFFYISFFLSSCPGWLALSFCSFAL